MMETVSRESACAWQGLVWPRRRACRVPGQPQKVGRDDEPPFLPLCSSCGCRRSGEEVDALRSIACPLPDPLANACEPSPSQPPLTALTGGPASLSAVFRDLLTYGRGSSSRCNMCQGEGGR